jgi:hypothetical protein
LDDIRPRIGVGILREPSWTGADARDLADELDADLSRLGTNSEPCHVIANIEGPYWSSADALEFLHEWRIHRPNRSTLLAVEFHKGGTFSSELVQAVNADVNLQVVPEAYIHDPPVSVDADLARCDITGRGVDPRRVHVFYLAGDVIHRESWDGIVFRFDQLP